ncbi:MAG TPA: 16S rRNA (guanine(966)-N(2))-methyltransferase RsmD [Thermoanaerobaculia bacterium]|nr:16S rRNA (guanine(966)-N(2))-methyltransferase RsmD [Thermoanaerobaculia bacterium]
MRVIAGSARGTKLLGPPSGAGARPITDRAKEALFSILGPSLAGARFLDLFSGTGAVGIEALSRGAAEAVFVEQHPAMIRILRANLEKTGLTGRGRIVRADVFEYLRREPEPFDVVYVAPPQYRRLWADALERLDQAIGDRRPGWVAEDGQVVVQVHPVELEEVELASLREVDRRDYGKVTLSFYERADAT